MSFMVLKAESQTNLEYQELISENSCYRWQGFKPEESNRGGV